MNLKGTKNHSPLFIFINIGILNILHSLRLYDMSIFLCVIVSVLFLIVLILLCTLDIINRFKCPLPSFFFKLQKKIKLKELQRKKKGWKKKSWPPTAGEVELFFTLIDIKVMSRVLKMTKISKEQLLWCEEKMSKLNFSGSKLQRNGSPILFPC